MADRFILAVGEYPSATDYLDIMQNGTLFLRRDSIRFTDESGTPRISGTLVGVGTMSERAAWFNNVQRFLNLASSTWMARNPADRVTLGVQRNTAAMVYYTVTGGEIDPWPINHPQHSEWPVTFEVLPYLHGAEQSVTLATNTLSNGTAILVDNIPGTAPALCKWTITDTSSSGSINKLRLLWQSAGTLSGAGEYDAWINPTALTGTDSFADAARFGGNYLHRSVSTSAWTPYARVTRPAGSLNDGKIDIYGSFRADESVIVYPSINTTPTINAPVYRSETVSRNTGSVDFTTTGYTGSPSVTANARDLMFMTTMNANTNEVPAAPTNWERLAFDHFQNTDGSYTSYALFRCTAATSQTFTAPATGSTSWALIQLTNEYAPSGSFTNQAHLYDLQRIDGQGPDISWSFRQPTPDRNTRCITVVGASTTGAGITAWGGGFLPWTSPASRISIGYQNIVDPGTSVSGTGLGALATARQGGFALMIRPEHTRETEITYEEPTPGELASGSWSFVVQAEDKAGGVSSWSGQINASVSVARSSITLSWSASAGSIQQYIVTGRAPDGRYYQWYTGTPDTSLTVTDIADANQVSAFPVQDADGSLALARVRVGTTGSPVLQPKGEPVALPESGSDFMLTRLATVELAPVPPLEDGTRPDWAFEIDLSDPSGAGHGIGLEAVVIVPHANNLEARTPIKVNAKRNWILEAQRSGRDTSARLLDPSNSSEAGTPVVIGVPTLPPGDSSVHTTLEGYDQTFADAVVLHTLSATVALAIRPRWHFQSS